MSIQTLEKYLDKETLTVEEHIDALAILTDLENELSSKEIVVEEPVDIDDDVQMVWTQAQLEKLLEVDVVAIANGLGITASVRDRKSDTIKAILDSQNS